MKAKRYGLAEAARDILLRSLPQAYPQLKLAQLGVDAVGAGAKVDRGLQIAAEAKEKWLQRAKAAGMTPNENYYDAMRHAEWMSRTARELGPDFARLAGAFHERTGSGDRYSHGMDDYNNDVAIRSVEQGRPYTADDLQRGRLKMPQRMSGALDRYMKPEHWPPRLRRQFEDAEARAEARRRSR
jgi:hypothetical protein